ncbi:hypothetical protein QQ39_15380 [Pragia fontium]|nr:hypothetical protein QQ39_15380 [Pragia fontium]
MLLFIQRESEFARNLTKIIYRWLKYSCDNAVTIAPKQHPSILAACSHHPTKLMQQKYKITAKYYTGLHMLIALMFLSVGVMLLFYAADC